LWSPYASATAEAEDDEDDEDADECVIRLDEDSELSSEEGAGWSLSTRCIHATERLAMADASILVPFEMMLDDEDAECDEDGANAPEARLPLAESPLTLLAREGNIDGEETGGGHKRKNDEISPSPSRQRSGAKEEATSRFVLSFSLTCPLPLPPHNRRFFCVPGAFIGFASRSLCLHGRRRSGVRCRCTLCNS
jgi:hypothetical protein